MTLTHFDDRARAEETARAWIALMAPAVELAKAIAGTDFVPKALRNNPAAIAAAILYGDEVGLGPLQSLSKIAVIDGRPALAAEAQRALVLAAGHDLWLEEYTVTAVTIAGKRRSSDVSNRVTWTLDDARRAGLAGRTNWRSYPRQMLLARSSAELCRATFPDVIGGLSALEELEEPDTVPPAEGADLALLAPQKSTQKRSRRRTATAEAAPVGTAPPDSPVPPEITATVSAPTPPEESSAEPPLPGEPGTDRMGETQRRRLFATFRAAGYSGEGSRARRLEFTQKFLGREIESSHDLTADEAARLIAALESGPPQPSAAPDAGEAPHSPAPPPAAGAAPASRPAAGVPTPAGAGTDLPAPAGDPSPAEEEQPALPRDSSAGDPEAELWELLEP